MTANTPYVGEDAKQIRARLPPAVYELALRLGADPQRRCASVSFRQKGRMRQVGGAFWMGFHAKQTISTLRCLFDWRAQLSPAGLIGVRDALTEAGGQLDVHALGFVPLVRADPSPTLWRGELMRYLAELPWAPSAILHNTELRWRTEGPDTLAVAAGSGETAAEVLLSLNGEGRIVGAFAPDRARSPKPPFLPTPWRGRFSDYQSHNGVWLPASGDR